MLRDMEELLNSVSKSEIKDYFREALNCYNSGSYKACVVFSVIAGMYDLHQKVKDMASSDEEFRRLDEEINERKNKLECYERYLVEQCGKEKIDMLNPNETKELFRCIDIRNDCAHPSDFICSAEKARDVYSSIIDIISSKPSLYGCNKINHKLTELKEKTFFPVINNEKIEKIIKELIIKFHRKAIPILMKQIAETIIKTDNDVQRKNAILFLAISEKCIDNYSEEYLSIFIKEENDKYLLQLLEVNINLLEYFSETNILKIIKIFEVELESKQIYYLDTWINVLLFKRVQESYFDEFIKKIFVSDYNIDNVIYIMSKVLNNDSCNEKVKDLLICEIYDNYDNIIKSNTIVNNFLLDILKCVDSSQIYEKWLETIIKSINNEYNFNRKNDIILDSFTKLPEDLWFDKVSERLKVDFVKSILDEVDPYKSNSAYAAQNLLVNFSEEYPGLSRVFTSQLLKDKDSKYFDKQYKDIVVKLFSDEIKKEEYIKKTNDYSEF